jgi:hypothetical protein
MEAETLAKTLGNFYQVTRRHIPEDMNHDVLGVCQIFAME